MAGSGVALGYLNQESLNVQQFGFISSNVSSNSAHCDTDTKFRVYRTGDIVCVSNQLLHYIGRRDRLLKINGQRINSGSIEELIMSFGSISPRISSALVVSISASHSSVPKQAYSPTVNESRRLICALLVLDSIPEHLIDPAAVLNLPPEMSSIAFLNSIQPLTHGIFYDELLDYLRSRSATPAHVPSKFFVLRDISHFPITNSGKIDVKRISEDLEHLFTHTQSTVNLNQMRTNHVNDWLGLILQSLSNILPDLQIKEPNRTDNLEQSSSDRDQVLVRSWGEIGLDSLLQEYFLNMLRRISLTLFNSSQIEMTSMLTISCLSMYPNPYSLASALAGGLKTVSSIENSRILNKSDEDSKRNLKGATNEIYDEFPLPLVQALASTTESSDKEETTSILSISRFSVFDLLNKKTFQTASLSKSTIATSNSNMRLQCEWRVQMRKCIDASPVMLTSSSGSHSVVYAADHSGLIVCSNINGHVIWRTKLPTRIEASPVVFISHTDSSRAILIIGIPCLYRDSPLMLISS